MRQSWLLTESCYPSGHVASHAHFTDLVGSSWAHSFASSQRTLPAALPNPRLASSGHLQQGRRLRREACVGSGERQVRIVSCCLQASVVLALLYPTSPDYSTHDFRWRKNSWTRTQFLPTPVINCLRSVSLRIPLFYIIPGGSSLVTWCSLSFPTSIFYFFQQILGIWMICYFKKVMLDVCWVTFNDLSGYYSMFQKQGDCWSCGERALAQSSQPWSSVSHVPLDLLPPPYGMS